MISRNRLMGALLCAVMLIAAAATASAQRVVVFSNPPCPNVTITNNTNCTAQLNWVFQPPAPGWPNPLLVPAGAVIVMPLPVGGVAQILGLNDIGGVFFPVNSPPPFAGVNCGPNEWWINNIILGPLPGCCFDVCFDPCNCRITLNRC